MCRPLDQRDDNALDEFWSETGMMRPDDINSDLSNYFFENFDSKFSEVNRCSSFDPNIILRYLEYLGVIEGSISLIEYAKKFIDFIKTRKKEEDVKQNITSKTDKSKDGTISIQRLYPGNVMMMKGNGIEKPVLEACNTMPLFIIQRGYILILSNLILHFNYDDHKLVQEFKAPSFMYDSSVEIVRTSSCDETPGLFRIKESIWVGNQHDIRKKKQ